MLPGLRTGVKAETVVGMADGRCYFCLTPTWTWRSARHIAFGCIQPAALVRLRRPILARCGNFPRERCKAAWRYRRSSVSKSLRGTRRTRSCGRRRAEHLGIWPEHFPSLAGIPSILPAQVRACLEPRLMYIEPFFSHYLRVLAFHEWYP